MSSKVRIFLVVLCFSGFLASAYLTHLYYDLRFGEAGFKAICDIGQKFQCGAVAASEKAELWPGFPRAALVAGWLLVLAGVIFKKYLKIALSMSVVGSFMSLWLLGVMIFDLKVYCVFCLWIDAVNFITLALLILNFKKNPPQQSEPWIATGIVALVAIAGTTALLRPSLTETQKQLEKNLVLYVERWQNTTPIVEPQGLSLVSAINTKEKTIRIVEFSDPQCPTCAKAAAILENLTKRFPGRIQLQVLPFPLDSKCNRIMESSMHPLACELSKGLICADIQGKGHAFNNWVFENQTQHTPNEWKGTAVRALALDGSAFSSCLESSETSKRLAGLIEDGIKANIQSTPTLLIQGKKMEGILPIPFWEKIIPLAEKL